MSHEEPTPRDVLRAVVAHGVVGSILGLVLALPFGRDALVAAPCFALLLALPAGATGWVAARGLGATRALLTVVAAGALVVPFVVVQASYLFGVVHGGIEAGYANIAELAFGLRRPIPAGKQGLDAALASGPGALVALLALGLGHGFVPGVVLLRRRAWGGTCSRVLYESAGVCLATSIAFTGAGAILLPLVEALAGGPGLASVSMVGLPMAGASLLIGTLLAPVWAGLLPLAERLEAGLPGRDRARHLDAAGEPGAPE